MLAGVWSRSPPESGFWPGVGAFYLKETPDSGPYLSHLDFCNFVAVCLTFVQFILQLKTLYTIVHLLLEEFKISPESLLSTQSLCHTISPVVGVRVEVLSPTKNQGLHIRQATPYFWLVSGNNVAGVSSPMPHVPSLLVDSVKMTTDWHWHWHGLYIISDYQWFIVWDNGL